MRRTWWIRLPVGDGRFLVYSPLFGRTYLLPEEFAASSFLPRLIGLKRENLRNCLADPAGSVALVDGAGLCPEAGSFLPRLYTFFHRYRAIVTIGRAILLAVWLVRLQGTGGHRSAAEIGSMVMAVERKLGVSDCYPRALLTAYLCLVAGLGCEVTVGILPPTKNLHAWCSTEGVIPYEPVLRHWWYRPLVVFDATR